LCFSLKKIEENQNILKYQYFSQNSIYKVFVEISRTDFEKIMYSINFFDLVKFYALKKLSKILCFSLKKNRGKSKYFEISIFFTKFKMFVEISRTDFEKIMYSINFFDLVKFYALKK